MTGVGEPPPKARLREEPHVDITTDETLADEVARLVAAGAILVEMRQDRATYADPDKFACRRQLITDHRAGRAGGRVRRPLQL